MLISEVEEVEIFKICLEYWNYLAADLYSESPFSPPPTLYLKPYSNLAVQSRREFYSRVLTKVCAWDYASITV